VLPKVAQYNLHQIDEIFRFGNPHAATPSLVDVVLVAIDFENVTAVKNGFLVNPNCQAGVAILDTRLLEESSANEPLRTYNFAIGTPSYIEEASKKFQFGDTITTSPQKLSTRIRSLIPGKRKVVLVGHGVMSDVSALKALGFQFPTRLLALLDTAQVAKEISNCWSGSLGDLLRELGCPHSKLHCAGNDANYTLKALLLLAAKRLERQSGNRNTVNMLRRIGRQELPYWVDAQGKHQ